MPCTAPVRGKTDLINPWEPLTDNDPCGKEDFAGGLCKLHWQMANGQVRSSIDGQTVLLLHADGPDGSTSFVDSSIYAHPMTAVGDAKVSTAQAKFGSALLLDGAGDVVTSPDSPDWDLGAGDFTIDSWLRYATVGAANLVGQWASGSRGWMFQVSAAAISFYYSVDGSTILNKSLGFAPVVATWYHIAVVRSGNTLLLFVNGTQVGGVQDVTGVVIFNSSAPLSVGADGAGGGALNGSLDEIRISKGIARWTSNFSVPTAPYT